MRYCAALLVIMFINFTAMAKEIKTEIIIHASPGKVWAIFSDFANYPNWNPFITLLSGQVKTGNKITVRIERNDARPMTFKPKILSLETNKELRWLGRLLVGGLVDGEHTFELIANSDGTTTFRQSEIFKGILVPFFGKKSIKKTCDGYEAMNRKLKELAEQN